MLINFTTNHHQIRMITQRESIYSHTTPTKAKSNLRTLNALKISFKREKSNQRLKKLSSSIFNNSKSYSKKYRKKDKSDKKMKTTIRIRMKFKRVQIMLKNIQKISQILNKKIKVVMIYSVKSNIQVQTKKLINPNSWIQQLQMEIIRASMKTLSMTQNKPHHRSNNFLMIRKVTTTNKINKTCKNF